MYKTCVPIENPDNWKRPRSIERDVDQKCTKIAGWISDPRTDAAPGSDVARRPFRLERRFLEFLYRKMGCPAVQIELWDGTVIGEYVGSVGRLVLQNPHGLRRLLFGLDLGFCEGYMDNDLDVQGDLVKVLTELNRCLSHASLMGWQVTSPQWPWTRHAIVDSQNNVHHHYDLGNDFYRLWLDPQLVYTCAYYEHSEDTLSDAQTAKLDYICHKLRLKPGQVVVEAGCGWGALALHMARNYGVKVRAFNLSQEQVAYARGRAKAEQLSDRVEFIDDDYRNINGKCDVFVSVGMLEHVGVENYRSLGQLVARILTVNGRGLIHTIGRNYAKPLDSWTVKYIFPGAYAPSLREMMDLFEPAGFSVLDIENLRLHYARTCADWLARFENHSESVREMFDERFVRMWRLYLAASTAAFLNGDLQLFQVLFARSNNNDLPLTRQDWYV